MSKVYSWRKLNEKELTRVYLDEMRRDFPPTELKPLSMILNSEADGTAHTWGVFDGETLAAYLLMVRPAGSRVSQLDYFAVLPEYRAAGLGAQLLADLPQHERGAQAILIEAECPDKAEDEAMAVRRLGFYSRCGARDTGFTEHLFDAWFRILVLDCPGAGTFADRQAVDAWWTATAAPSARPSGRSTCSSTARTEQNTAEQKALCANYVYRAPFCHIFVDRLPKSGTLKAQKNAFRGGQYYGRKNDPAYLYEERSSCGCSNLFVRRADRLRRRSGTG